MCGILGIINNSLNSEEINKRVRFSLNLIKYRGPDASNFYADKNYGLGSVRLSIENLQNGKQPIFDKSSNLIIGFNGEIFNYKDLIKRYSLNEKYSEIQLLLSLYKKIGVEFFHEIQGQFAIFIFNVKTNELILARDKYGIRPLYYHLENKNIYFGSEIKTIFGLTKKTFNISQDALKQSALLWTCVRDTCAFSGIKKIEPSSYIIFKNGKIVEKKKFFLKKNLNFLKENKSIDLKNLVEDAVKRQLQSDVGYACYLSGGIDSAIIAYTLSKLSKKKLDTFSVSFKNSEYDESKYQKLMSNFLGSNHHSITISNDDISKNFYETINHTESLLFRTAPVPMYLLSKLVKKKNHKVIFTGEGADEILYGYDIYIENRIRKFWSKQPNSKIRPSLLKKLYDYLPQFKNERYFNLTKDFYLKTLNQVDDIFYSHKVRWDQFNNNKLFFNFEDDKIDDILYKLEEDLPNNYSSLNIDQKAQIIEIKTLLSNYLLSSQGDKVSLANSVEGRYPYLDDEFVKSVSSLNSNKLAESLKTKSFLRKSFEKVLPKEIVYRSKFAYQAPEASAFVSSEHRSDLFLDFQDNLKEIELINTNNFKQLINKIQSPYATKRLSFRENMSFILGLSMFCLYKNSKKWIN